MQRSARPFGRRVVALAAIFSLASFLLLLFDTPGQAQVPYASADIKASATGTVLHAGALQSGSTRLLDGELAFSGAAYNSEGLTSALSNEMQRQYAAADAKKLASARASALEVGLGVTPTDPNQVIISGEAAASSPPVSKPVTKTVGPVPAGPLAWASLLTGTAAANADQNFCALGDDLSDGTANAADAQLLDTGTSTPAGLQSPVLSADAPTPDRAVSNSTSRTLFVAQRDEKGKLQGPDMGVLSEVRETIAPVTFFKGTPNQFTIEVLGEWVLQTVATGLDGGSYVHYGPVNASPSTPILRVVQASGTQTLTFQDIFGAGGQVITIPGIAEIVIGEAPRAINGATGSKPTTALDGTNTSAAVDVVRVRSLPGAPASLADIRLGHMEASATVPRDGVSCPVPITKTPSASSVPTGGTFTTTFTVTNPFKCTLQGVAVTDDVSTTDGATFTVGQSDGSFSGSSTQGTITFPSFDLKPGAKKDLTATFTAGSGSGTIVDTARAMATLKDCAAPGATVNGVDVSVTNSSISGASPAVPVSVGTAGTSGTTAVEAAVATPVANGAVASSAPSNGQLPRTGAEILRLVAIAMLCFVIGFAGIAIKAASRAS